MGKDSRRGNRTARVVYLAVEEKTEKIKENLNLEGNSLKLEEFSW